VNIPTHTTSGIYLVRMREDLPRDAACDYWAGPHGQLVTHLPAITEYNQYHLSATDRGFWPATTTVGTIIPPSWPADGLTEVRLSSLVSALRTPLHMREIFFDEQNLFEHCLGHMTGPRGGRWWTAGHDDSVGHRTVLLLRRRRASPADRSARSCTTDSGRHCTTPAPKICALTPSGHWHPGRTRHSASPTTIRPIGATTRS